MPSSLRKRIDRSVDAARSSLLDAAAFDETLQRLVSDGDISESDAEYLESCLGSQVQESRYILGNLGAHLGIAAVFAFDMIPLPLGTIARVSWVAGARIVESWRRNADRARVHSLGVFLVAAIPWFGYAAYLLPLRSRSRELAFVLANHTWLARTGRTYEQFLAGAPVPVRRFARWLAPQPVPGVDHPA